MTTPGAQPHPLDCRPLSRWVILPADPPPLVEWLRARQAEEPEVYGLPPLPEPPPDDPF